MPTGTPYTKEYFIEKAKEVHGDKYDYSRIKEIHRASDKVCILCPKHGEFWQEARGHLRGYGCKKCYNERQKYSSRNTTEEFIKSAKRKHGDFFDYSKVDYKTLKDPVCIICPKHGEFWQTPARHLVANGCTDCVNEARYGNVETFIEKARKIHGDKYDYSKVIYKDSKSNVLIICPKHGEFLQSPHTHLSGCGCKECGSEKIKQRHTKDTEYFVKKSREIHGDKYDYSKVDYKNIFDKVCIVCPKHGDFWQSPSIHYLGCGCPKCSGSKGERRITTFLDTHSIEFQDQFTAIIEDNGIKHKVAYDFYIPKYNLMLEYQGEQHYQFIKHFYKTQEEFLYRQHLDYLKADYAIKNGYNFIPIPYWDFDHIDEILTDLIIDPDLDLYSDWT